MTTTTQNIKLLILNAVEDFNFREEIKKALKSIVENLKVDITEDVKIGETVEEYLYKASQEANIILLLMSSDLFANEQLSDIIDFVADLHHKGVKTLVPIVCRKFFAPLDEKLQTIPFLPTHGDIASVQDKNNVYAEIARYMQMVFMLVSLKLELLETKRELQRLQKTKK